MPTVEDFLGLLPWLASDQSIAQIDCHGSLISLLVSINVWTKALGSSESLKEKSD